LDLLFHERRLWEAGYQRIAGLDEAGRGPLAGPLVCAACIPFFPLPPGLNDSKKLSPLKRERIYQHLITSSIYQISIIGVEEIDRLNILQATFEGFRRSAAAFPIDYRLIDGNLYPFDLPGEALIGGDGLSASIAAASVLAKVTRDRILDELAISYPGYGFEKNKGYGTAQHLAALRRLGPTPIHRRTFLPSPTHQLSFLY
jgi:ribonuclease HII